MTSGEAEVEVASDGIGENTEHNTNHGKSSVELLSSLVVGFDAVTVESFFGHIHARLGCPHVLLTLIVS